jgi:hypothetical protein
MLENRPIFENLVKSDSRRFHHFNLFSTCHSRFTLDDTLVHNNCRWLNAGQPDEKRAYAES